MDIFNLFFINVSVFHEIFFDKINSQRHVIVILIGDMAICCAEFPKTRVLVTGLPALTYTLTQSLIMQIDCKPTDFL